MRKSVVAMLGIAFATAASAQVLGGGGVVGGTVGGGLGGPVTGSVNATTGAAAGVQVDGAPARGTAESVGRVASRTGNAVADARPSRSVEVGVGASTRVNRGTRCYHDADYWEPVYRDGSYYCERRTSGAGVAARVNAGR